MTEIEKLNDAYTYVKDEVSSSRFHQDIRLVKQYIIGCISRSGNELHEALYDEDFPIARDIGNIITACLTIAAREDIELDMEKIVNTAKEFSKTDIEDMDVLNSVNDILLVTVSNPNPDEYIPIIITFSYVLLEKVKFGNREKLEFSYCVDLSLEDYHYVYGTICTSAKRRRLVNKDV